jgi:hypothetical protein
MRVLFASLASAGHTYPLIPLAIAVRDAGHEVHFAAGEHVHPALAAHGLRPFRPADSFYELYSEDLAPELDRLRPDLVVHGWGVPGAAAAAAEAGIPGLWHGFGRAIPPGIGLAVPPVDGVPHLDICPPSLQDKDFLATTNRIALRPVPYSPPTTGPPSGTTGSGPGTARSGSGAIGWGPGAAGSGSGAAGQASGGVGPGWKDVTGAGAAGGSVVGGRPLVYLTLGTAFGTPELLTTAIEGLALVGARVVVAAGRVPPEELGTLPDGVTVLPWVDQAELLRRVDLVVHHGGSGTTLGALAAGVPQLVMPQGADQFANADALYAAGAALRLLPPEVGVAAVARHASTLLPRRPSPIAHDAVPATHSIDRDAVPATHRDAARTPDRDAAPAGVSRTAAVRSTYHDAARAIADEIAGMPTPAEVARVLPSLV